MNEPKSTNGVAAPRARVALIPCPDYEIGRTRAAVAAALALLDGVDAQLQPGRTVLLKPNLLSSTQGPERPVNTHAAVVRAVAEYALARGCRVRIGDSCGRVAAHATDDALDVSGLRALAAELGADAVNFDREPHQTFQSPGSGFLPHVNISRAVLDADVVISLPKLKTHGLTYFTGAIKNMFGAVPGKGKKVVHMQAPKPHTLAAALVDIFSLAPPHLTLMDAVIAMEGSGPNSGQPRHVGALIASRDAVALDAVACHLVDFSPDDVLTTRLAAERGLGVGDMDRIEVVGADLQSLRVPGFRKPFGKGRLRFFALIPDGFIRWLLKMPAGAHSEVDPDKCTHCGQCVANCPAKALAVDGNRIVCDPKKCIACYCCEEVCDFDAAHVAESFLFQLLRRVAGSRR